MLSFCLSLIDDAESQSFFENIYHTYCKQMLYLARSFLKNGHDAEDAVHDVFEQIARKHLDTLQKIADERDLRNYLLKATKNTCLNCLKKKAVLIPSEDIANDKSNPELSDSAFLDLICKRADANLIKTAITALPDPYREVMYYHFVVDLSVQEIAKLTGRNLDTVKKQVSRGKQKLLAELDCRGGVAHVHDNS